MSHRLIVLKFGGSVLRDTDSLLSAVHEVRRWRRDGWRVVAVVSALAGETDSLLAECERLCPSREGEAPHAWAALVALGEQRSAALLGLHLEHAGLPARVLTPAAVSLEAAGSALDASPESVHVPVLQRALDEVGLVVFPGYTALDASRRTVVLGRGGSDLSALFLAARLGAARCRLIKDVDGLYERDPAASGPPPARFEVATFADALATDGSIVQHKAVRFAQREALLFEVGGLGADRATVVGGTASRMAAETADAGAWNEGTCAANPREVAA